MTADVQGKATRLDSRSISLRRTIVEMLRHSRRGHIGSAFSLVEILRVLYDDVLRYDSQNPKWPDRDRCILSKGHGCLALYPLLAEHGFFPSAELKKFCQPDGILGGHPETKVPGVEASTGSLGHGLSIGVGLALNAHLDRSQYRVFVVLGDGETNEGSIWEAAMCASKHQLGNLTVIIDRNHQQSYGQTSDVQELEPFADKWKSFGFSVLEVDGHNVNRLRQILQHASHERTRPTAVICHTIKGKGVSFTENNLEWHHRGGMTDSEIHALDEALLVANA